MNRGIVWCPHCGKPHQLGTSVCPTSAKSLDRGIHDTKKNQPAHPLLGVLIAGKYQILKLIGTGGMGEVFEAENRILKRLVAIKIVRVALTSEEAAARLEREAMLVAAVQHPNICDIYDFGALSDGSPFLVLERLFGETIAQKLARKGRLQLGPVLDVFSQVLSGLQAAHGAHIVHRDLKPQNIFLADRLGVAPLVKLLDFGFAKDVSGVRARTITRPGSLLGTVKYMAPEQLAAQKPDPRADLFSVGVILYESLTGKHPFEGPTLADFQANILRSEPRRIDHVVAGIPPAVHDAVARALAKDPTQRYQTAVEFQRALRESIGLRTDMNSVMPPDGGPPSGA